MLLRASLILLALPLAGGGCSSLTCGAGTVQQVNAQTGAAECVAPAASGIPCDGSDGGTAHLVGGVCEGDPGKFPTCGANTALDPKTNTCVVVGSNTVTPEPCPTPDATHICVNGIVRNLPDGSYTKGTVLQIGAYDPLVFLANPMTPPLAMTTTDANGTYILPSIDNTKLGTGLVAIAVADSLSAPVLYLLSGSGAQNLQGGTSYQVDVWAVQKTTVAGWDTQAGLGNGDNFEAHGAYVGIFVSGADITSTPVPGVTLTFGNPPMPATGQYFFKGDRGTIDPKATVTDASGSVVQLVVSDNLGSYSGMGGMDAMGQAITWPSILGASVPNVVFVQVFHPMTP